MTRMTHGAVAVLGAGLQGTCVALELAKRGVSVILIERDAMAMNRASLRNEGKIHLGLIYANGTSFATAQLQLQGALSFRAHLARWLGSAADTLECSSPFAYLVANDSLVSPQHLEAHYGKVERAYLEQIAADRRMDYLGRRPDRLYRPMETNEVARYFRAERFQAGFLTEELSIDPAQLARLIRNAVASTPGICFFPSRRVCSVERGLDSFRIEGESLEGSWTIHAEQVVNATWENRFAIDRTLGLHNEPGWVHRLKYRVLAELPESLRHALSATMVLGPYGDVVIRSDCTAYLSWYPIGLKGWTHDLKPPEEWELPCSGQVRADEGERIAAPLMSALDEWFPGIAQSKPYLVDAGVIVAYGRTDVDDPGSALHDRTRIGVRSVDGYHSVDPGKLTTAPLFAMQAADQVLDVLPRT